MEINDHMNYNLIVHNKVYFFSVSHGSCEGLIPWQKMPGLTIFDLPSPYQSFKMCIIQIYFCIPIKHGVKIIRYILSYTHKDDTPQGIIL